MPYVVDLQNDGNCLKQKPQDAFEQTIGISSIIILNKIIFIFFLLIIELNWIIIQFSLRWSRSMHTKQLFYSAGRKKTSCLKFEVCTKHINNITGHFSTEMNGNRFFFDCINSTTWLLRIWQISWQTQLEEKRDLLDIRVGMKTYTSGHSCRLLSLINPLYGRVIYC